MFQFFPFIFFIFIVTIGSPINQIFKIEVDNTYFISIEICTLYFVNLAFCYVLRL